MNPNSINTPPPGIITAIFLFGIYTNIGWDVAGGTISGISAIPGFVLLLPYVWKSFLRPVFFALLGLSIIPLLFSVFNTSGQDLFQDRLIASGQLAYSITIGYVLFQSLAGIRRESAASIFLYASATYVVLLAVEVLTPLKAVTVWYINEFLVGYDYTVLNRDIGLAGGHRPKFFTSETSYVAMTFTFMLGCYVWLAEGSRKFAYATALWVLGAVVIRSPIVLAFPLIGLASYVSSLKEAPELRRISAILMPVLLIAGILFSTLAWQVGQPLFQARTRSIQSGSDYSATFRTTGTMAAATTVANDNKIAGVGMGTHYLAEDTIKATFIAKGVPPLVVATEWRRSLVNAFAFSLIVLGYGGSIVFWGVLMITLRNLSGSLQLPFYASVFVLMCSFGAFYTPKFICHMMLFAAVNAIIFCSRSATSPQGPRRLLQSRRPTFPMRNARGMHV